MFPGVPARAGEPSLVTRDCSRGCYLRFVAGVLLHDRCFVLLRLRSDFCGVLFAHSRLLCEKNSAGSELQRFFCYMRDRSWNGFTFCMPSTLTSAATTLHGAIKRTIFYTLSAFGLCCALIIADKSLGIADMRSKSFQIFSCIASTTVAVD